MKPTLTLVLAALLLVLVIIVALKQPTVHSQQPQPSPTPVNQHWRVIQGEVFELQGELQKLNTENITVPYHQIKISQDGKRFVILLCDEPQDEE